MPQMPRELLENYRAVRLTPRSAPAYGDLTYPYYRHRLKDCNFAAQTIAVGLQLGRQPVGLALAAYNPREEAPGQRQGDLLSLFVAPVHRGRGQGTLLLHKLEAVLREQGCREIHFRYLSGTDRPPLERLLRNARWTPPTEAALVCHATTERVKGASGAHLTRMIGRLQARLPANGEVFLWTALTADERAAVQLQLAQDPLARRFNPFFEECNQESLNSLGLRIGGEILGWIITHRVAADTVRYTQLYVRPRYAALGHSALLLAKAIQLQVQAQTATKGTFRVDMENRAMVQFVRRRLAPYLEQIRIVLAASKRLSEQACAING